MGALGGSMGTIGSVGGTTQKLPRQLGGLAPGQTQLPAGAGGNPPTPLPAAGGATGAAAAPGGAPAVSNALAPQVAPLLQQLGRLAPLLQKLPPPSGAPGGVVPTGQPPSVATLPGAGRLAAAAPLTGRRALGGRSPWLTAPPQNQG